LVHDDLLFSIFEEVERTLGVKCWSWRLGDLFVWLSKLGTSLNFTEIGAIVEFRSEILFVDSRGGRMISPSFVFILVGLFSWGLVIFLFRFIMGCVEFFVQWINWFFHSFDSLRILRECVMSLLWRIGVQSFLAFQIHTNKIMRDEIQNKK
jgi:hypothetical protein